MFNKNINYCAYLDIFLMPKTPLKTLFADGNNPSIVNTCQWQCQLSTNNFRQSTTQHWRHNIIMLDIMHIIIIILIYSINYDNATLATTKNYVKFGNTLSLKNNHNNNKNHNTCPTCTLLRKCCQWKFANFWTRLNSAANISQLKVAKQQQKQNSNNKRKPD